MSQFMHAQNFQVTGKCRKTNINIVVSTLFIVVGVPHLYKTYFAAWIAPNVQIAELENNGFTINTLIAVKFLLY